MRPRIPLCMHRRFSLTHTHTYSTTPTPTPTPLLTLRSIPAPHSGCIRILSLNNPGSRNAISKALLEALRGRVGDIYAEGLSSPSGPGGVDGVDGPGGPDGPYGPTRALIIASEVDAAFCAGADLKERRGFSREETSQYLTSLRSTLTSISRLPIPTITAISSLALGGGLELALSTNLRIFASSALVALPETRLAIIPGAGGTYRLPALIGRSRALEMMLTGRRVGGAEAYFMGLCERLVDVGDKEGMEAGVARERVLQGAVEWARAICEGGPGAVRAVLRAVGGGEEVEGREYERVVGMKDRDEALRAFAEKRKPVFRGV